MNIHEIRIYPHGWKGVIAEPCLFIALRDSVGPQPFGYVTPIPENHDSITWTTDALSVAQDYYWANGGKLPPEWKKVIITQTGEAHLCR